MVVLLCILAIAILAYIVYRMPGGCEGDCKQGRKECNCKKMQ